MDAEDKELNGPGLRFTPAAATWGFDAESASGLQFAGAFAGKKLLLAVADNDGLPFCTGVTACKAPRCGVATIGEQGDLCVAEKFDFAGDAVAPAVLPRPARVTTDAVTDHTERVRILERFDWRIEGVGHVRVMPTRAV